MDRRDKGVADIINHKFELDPVKIKEEAKTHGWDIDGEEIEAAYKKHMNQ